MKQTGIFILSMLLVSALFAQTNLVNIPRIKATYSVGDNGDTLSYTEYSYDKLGRCIKVIMHDSYFGYDETIEYPDATTVVSTKTYTRDNVIRITKYTLNAKGQAVSYSQVEKGRTEEDRFLYNTAGFAVLLGNVGWMNATDEELKEENFNVNTLMLINKGNVIKNESGDQFDFYFDKLNTIGNKNIGIGYLGNDNKNLIKERSTPVMDTYVKNTYTYQFDKKGRVIKQKESPNNFVTLYSYVN